jgi:hypothetical protein
MRGGTFLTPSISEQKAATAAYVATSVETGPETGLPSGNSDEIAVTSKHAPVALGADLSVQIECAYELARTAQHARCCSPV